MLRWISEHERESTKALRCPACKGKIQTTEPKDSFVGLRDRLHKMYSRITPAILLGVVTGCSSRFSRPLPPTTKSVRSIVSTSLFVENMICRVSGLYQTSMRLVPRP